MENYVYELVQAGKKASTPQKYLFDGFPHPTGEAFHFFFMEHFMCPPEYVFVCSIAEPNTLTKRYMKKLEVEELNDE
jgi:hypothetical protein